MRFPSFARARRFGRHAVGLPWWVYLTGIASALALACLILVLPLLAELLATSGNLTVPTAEAAELKALGLTPDVADEQLTIYKQRGMLPTVWRLRSTWLGGISQSLYAAWPALQSNSWSLIVLTLLIIVLSFVAAGLLFWHEVALQRAAIRVTGALRRQIFSQSRHLGAYDLFCCSRLSAADLFLRRADILRHGLALWWRTTSQALVFLAFIVVLAVSVDLWLTLAAIILVGLGAYWYYQAQAYYRRQELIADDKSQTCAELVEEDLQHNRLLGHLAEQPQSDARSLDDNLRHFEAAVLARESQSAHAVPLRVMFAAVCASIVLMLAGFNIVRDPPRLTLAGMVLFAGALGSAVYPLIRWNRLWRRLPLAESAATEIFTYLDREPRVGQLSDAKPLPRPASQIAFDHVSLAAIDGHLLLDDVSFALPVGGRTVLFSSDDSAPLAVAGLISRFCDPTSGRITFDGQEARHATVDSIRRQVCLVLPEHLLVAGTIRENLVSSQSKASQAELVEALKFVHAYDFIGALPEGLETVVGPRGMTLSAGESILIGLARVVLRDPPVIVIAEPQDDLDQATAERVADALDRVAAGRTLVVLARRLATLRLGPRILLFHKGRLLADGSHVELLQSNEFYRHLNYVRFNEFRDKPA